jgi:hypothetical protein
MKTLATFSDPDAVAMLAGLLEKQGIASQRAATLEESGLEAIDLQVADDQYEAACNVAEQWIADCEAAHEKRTTRRCTVCNSPHLETVPETESVIRCRDCGHIL